MAIEIRPAAASEVPAVIDVPADASAWLASLGVDQWPKRFSDSFISATAERGELYVAVDEPEVVVGTITLQWSDPMFWAERCDAGFFHRLAIRRSHAGLGRRLIDWADDHTEQREGGPICAWTP